MDDDEVVLGHSTLGKAKLTRLRPSKAQAKSTVQQVPSSQEKTKLTGLILSKCLADKRLAG